MIKTNETAKVGEGLPYQDVINSLPFNKDGLLPAIAQQYDSGRVLMLAWMDRAALQETINTGRVCYYSRSRAQLWRKGESSNQIQSLVDLRLDCDGDTILLLVDQHGAACHTGRESCFYNALRGDQVEVIEDPLIPPDQLYRR